MNPKVLAKPLTEVELEMMQVIWKSGPSTVTQIQQSLAQGRDLAYTSVSTIVRILEQKNYLKTSKEGRGFLYAPTISKEEYQKRSTQHFVKKVFDGTPSSLVRQLIESETLSKSDLQDLQALIQKREKADG